MTLASPLLVIAFAGLLHASFQLGVSLLTLLSGHGLGLGRSRQRLRELNVAYVSGAAIMTILLFAGVAYLAMLTIGSGHQVMWLILSVLNVAIGLAVMIFYYRRSKGTGLWIPRSMAEYLTQRTKKTKNAAEAFTLGAGSVLAEVPFLVGPLGLAVLYTVSQTSPNSQLASLLIYSTISLAPLVAILVLVQAGSKISSIQRWREENKLFLQLCAGSGLVILGCFVFVDRCLGVSI